MRNGMWDHASCGRCLAKLRRPSPIRLSPGDSEICCFCGSDTTEGFYLHQDPKLTPCQGGVGPASLLQQRVEALRPTRAKP